MPIYAYRCATCGNAKDVLQKMSDPLLTVCPFCGAPTFEKQVTAAGFQLKGSGWYVTDFRGGDKPATPSGDAKPSTGDAAKPDAGKSDSSSASPSAAPAASKSDAGATPAAAPPAAPSSSSSDKK
jgi:putative FmdB family regulatory protein